MNTAKIKTLLNLAQRPRKLAIGSSAVEANLKKKNVSLLLLSEDAGANLERKLQNQINTLELKCPIIPFLTKAELGEMLNRPDVAVVGVLDKDFANGILMYTKSDGS